MRRTWLTACGGLLLLSAPATAQYGGSGSDDSQWRAPDAAALSPEAEDNDHDGIVQSQPRRVKKGKKKADPNCKWIEQKGGYRTKSCW